MKFSESLKWLFVLLLLTVTPSFGQKEEAPTNQPL